MKKLRRKGIAEIATANTFLETEYWADHNARFAQAPAASDDFHVARPRGLRLDTVFRLEEDRTVSNDWVVRYDNRFLQLERQSGHAPARSNVVVCESVDGHLEIRFKRVDGERVAGSYAELIAKLNALMNSLDGEP